MSRMHVMHDPSNDLHSSCCYEEHEGMTCPGRRYEERGDGPQLAVPPLTLGEAVQAATEAIDRAHADGLVIPPQAAAAVAMLDTTAQLLAGQVSVKTVTKP